MPALFEAGGARLLTNVAVSGVGEVTEEDAARVAAVRTASYEEQMNLLQRQLFRLATERHAPGAAAGDGSGAARSDADKSDSEPESDDEDAWGSGAEDDGKGEEPTESSATAGGPKQRGSLVHFRNEQEQWLTLYRDVLPSRGIGVTDAQVKAEIEALPTDARPWAFFMCAGGHFAAAIVAQGKVLKHKCIHRYVVRAKRGTVQSARDSKSGTSAPKSAGAQIRRYNEAQLQREIEELLRDWAPQIESCALIFHRTSVNNRGFVFRSRAASAKAVKQAPGLLDFSDPRVRSIPFPTGRPTLREVTRIYAHLVSLEPSAKEPELIRLHRESEAKAAKAAEVAAATAAAAPAASEESKAQEVTKVSKPLLDACGRGHLAFVRRHLHAAPPPEDASDVPYQFAPPTEPLGEDVDLNAVDDKGNTALHIAAQKGYLDIVQVLLASGADPCLLDDRGKTPYDRSKSREARNVFRRFRAARPDAYDFEAAHIPSALTRQAEEAQARQKAEKEQRLQEKKEREAQAAAAAEPTPKATPAVRLSASASARERRAAAALTRMQQSTAAAPAEPGHADPAAWKGPFCTYCGKPAGVGKNPVFRRLDYEYCSMACLRTHKAALAH